MREGWIGLDDNSSGRGKLGPTRKRFGGRFDETSKGRRVDGFLRDGKGEGLRKRGGDDLGHERRSLFWKDNGHRVGLCGLGPHFALGCVDDRSQLRSACSLQLCRLLL